MPIVAVPDGVAADLSRLARRPRKRITTIFNAVDVSRIRELAAAPIADGWFAEGAPPVLRADGRLAPQKDYGTLLRAFAFVRSHRPRVCIVRCHVWLSASRSSWSMPSRIRRVTLG